MEQQQLLVVPGACEIQIPLKRQSLMFMMQRLLPQFLVVQGGLGAMWLNPNSPPLVGGRCGLLITSMLLVSNRLSDSTVVGI